MIVFDISQRLRMVITIARDVNFDLRRGGGSALELLYGEVSISPTLMHSVSTAVVLPAPTKVDLIAGKATFSQVAPTPAPVDGKIDWAYKVVITDRRGKTWEYLIGVPDAVPPINFNVLPRYFETRPPNFGVGPQGPAGTSATVAVGTTTSGPTPAVVNSGTATNAVFDFTLAQGAQGIQGAGTNYMNPAPSGDDLPSSYAQGVNYFSIVSNVGTGWPIPNITGTVTKAVNNRTERRIVSISGVTMVSSSASSAAWTPWVTIPSSDIATITANGLMPAADKAKLDGMTPAAYSKTFAALASTYQTGLSTVQVRSTDGWPITSDAQAVTFKTASGAANTTQWIYPVEGTTPVFRVADAAGVWGSVQVMATQSYVDSKATGVNVKAFGATGNGTTLDSTAIYAALEAATALGLPLDIPKGTYRMNGFMEIPSGGEIRMSPGCVLDFSGSGATYHLAARGVLGTPLSTGTFTRGSRVLTIPSSGLTTNMWIRINSDDVYDPASTSTTLGELVQVLSVAGTQVTLASPLQDTYVTNVRVFPITPVENVVISGGTVRGNFTPNTNKTGIYLSLVVNGEINGTKTEGIDRSHVSIIDCVNVWTDKTKHVWAKHDNQAYGVSFADCTRNSGTTSAWFSDVRHALSTNNSSTVGGIVRDITFSYSTVQYTSLAVAGGSGGDALDTHTAAEDIKILFNNVLGSSGQGINFECTSGIIQGNVVRNSQATAIGVHNESSRTGKIKVLDNTVAFANGLGINVRAGVRGTPTRYEAVVVSGNDVADVTGVGIRVGFSTATSERGAVIANNTVTRTGGRGMEFVLIDALATSGNTLVDCVGGGILYDRIIYGSLGPDSIRPITDVEGTPYIAIDCLAVTRSSLRPGGIRATGTGGRGVRIAATCADMSVLGTSHIFATMKVENLAGATVIVSN